LAVVVKVVAVRRKAVERPKRRSGLADILGGMVRYYERRLGVLFAERVDEVCVEMGEMRWDGDGYYGGRCGTKAWRLRLTDENEGDGLPF
jgi:hypothetical protein